MTRRRSPQVAIYIVYAVRKWLPISSRSIPAALAGGHRPRRQRVRRGKLVAIPTGALYTLIADPFNLSAVTRVFRAKGREINPLPAVAGL